MSVRTKVIGGVVVIGLAVLLLTSVDWQRLNLDTPRSNPVNPQVDQRLFVEAVVSSEINKPFQAAWTGAGVGSGMDYVGTLDGWAPLGAGNTWKQTFGPYKRGDNFVIRVVGTPGTYTKCALRTVGKAQLNSPPHAVVGKDGQATCTHVAGD